LLIPIPREKDSPSGGKFCDLTIKGEDCPWSGVTSSFFSHESANSIRLVRDNILKIFIAKKFWVKNKFTSSVIAMRRSAWWVTPAWKYLSLNGKLLSEWKKEGLTHLYARQPMLKNKLGLFYFFKDSSNSSSPSIASANPSLKPIWSMVSNCARSTY